MKSFKTLLSAFAIVAVFSSGAFAQSAGSGSINSTANVVNQMTVNAEQALDFGTLVVGETRTIASDSSAAGIFSVDGALSSASIDLEVVFPASLSDGGTSNLSTSAYTASYEQGADINPTDGTVTSFTTQAQTSTTTITTSGTEFSVYVGMSVDATGADPTTHNGTVTLNLDYN